MIAPARELYEPIGADESQGTWPLADRSRNFMIAEQAGAWDRLRGLQPMSLCDWPGRSTAVFFMGGCNLRCPTCHNYELAWRMDSLPRPDRPRVLIHLAERKRWLDGLTITGGEPTTVPGLRYFLAELQDFGLPIKVDTNGMRPDVVAELLAGGLADIFAVDVKGPFSKYPMLTGGAVDPATAESNLASIFAMAADFPEYFYFRLTHVPGLNEADIETARSYLPSGFGLTIQQFKAPRRNHAPADQEEGRPVGDLVIGQDRPSHSQSPQRQRDQGSPAGQEARLQG